MRLFEKTKDGGSKSPVDVYFLIENKKLFSIALLRFDEGSRENFHNHAFKAWTWFLFGDLIEEKYEPPHNYFTIYKRSLFPKVTEKDNLHKVHAQKTSWCFTIRGPWLDKWQEYNEKDDKTITLTHGRKIVNE